MRRAAEPAAVPALRALTRQWLIELDLDLDPDTAQDVVLAVDEAVTNAVEHAFPHRADGTVGLELTRCAGGGLEVVVDDDGTWRPIPEDPGFRGRGLELIDRLADRASVTHTRRGTVARMRWAI